MVTSITAVTLKPGCREEVVGLVCMSLFKYCLGNDKARISWLDLRGAKVRYSQPCRKRSQ